MLNLLGTIGANVLGLPGILGVALGMMTRNWMLGMAIGATVGAIETLVFAEFQLAQINMLELLVSLLVGAAAGILGSAIRIKGTTV